MQNEISDQQWEAACRRVRERYPPAGPSRWLPAWLARWLFGLPRVGKRSQSYLYRPTQSKRGQKTGDG